MLDTWSNWPEFADNIVKMHFVQRNLNYLLQISMKYIGDDPLENKPITCDVTLFYMVSTT